MRGSHFGWWGPAGNLDRKSAIYRRWRMEYWYRPCPPQRRARFYCCAVSLPTFSKEFELVTLCHASCVSSVVLEVVLECFYTAQEDLLAGKFIESWWLNVSQSITVLLMLKVHPKLSWIFVICDVIKGAGTPTSPVKCAFSQALAIALASKILKQIV